MSGKQLEEKVASASELPSEQAVAVLRDVILGHYPNDADSVKAKESVSLFCRNMRVDAPGLQKFALFDYIHNLLCAK